LKLHRLATANDRLRVAEPRALPMRVAADFLLNLIAYNLIRIPKLRAA
jgi:hypothetical protein